MIKKFESGLIKCPLFIDQTPDGKPAEGFCGYSLEMDVETGVGTVMTRYGFDDEAQAKDDMHEHLEYFSAKHTKELKEKIEDLKFNELMRQALNSPLWDSLQGDDND